MLTIGIGPESDHCLPLSLTNWLTDSLTHSLLFSKLDWCDPGVWRCQLKTCWGLLLLLMLMMRIVLATVWCILGSWSLVIKPNFCSDFEHKVCLRLWNRNSGKTFKLEFRQYFASDVRQHCYSFSWLLKIHVDDSIDFVVRRLYVPIQSVWDRVCSVRLNNEASKRWPNQMLF